MKIKKFDKEYQTSYVAEYLYLRSCGIPYVFIKNIGGITVWKYRKDSKLFDALKRFYETNQ